MAVLALLALFGLVVQFGPVGADWFYTFRPVARDFAAGNTQLYDNTEYGYFNMPWLMVVLVPLALLPVRVGQALLTLISLSLVLVSLRAFTRSIAVTALAVCTPFVVDLVLRGQVDALVLAGVVLTLHGLEQRRSWVLAGGLWLMSVKPPNVLLVFALAGLVLLRWTWRERLQAVSLLGVSFVISLPFCGFDWPARYLGYYQDKSVYTGFSVSLWARPEVWLLASAVGFLWWWGRVAWRASDMQS